MQLKTGIIIGLAFTLSGALSGCATSPFFVSKEDSYAPGFVPRNELGQPILPATRTPDNRKPSAGTGSNPPPAAPKPSSWLSK